MKPDDISKVLNESKAKRCEETEALRKLSDVDFCGNRKNDSNHGTRLQMGTVGRVIFYDGT